MPAESINIIKIIEVIHRVYGGEEKSHPPAAAAGSVTAAVGLNSSNT